MHTLVDVFLHKYVLFLDSCWIEQLRTSVGFEMLIVFVVYAFSFEKSNRFHQLQQPMYMCRFVFVCLLHNFV